MHLRLLFTRFGYVLIDHTRIWFADSRVLVLVTYSYNFATYFIPCGVSKWHTLRRTTYCIALRYHLLSLSSCHQQRVIAVDSLVVVELFRIVFCYLCSSGCLRKKIILESVQCTVFFYWYVMCLNAEYSVGSKFWHKPALVSEIFHFITSTWRNISLWCTTSKYIISNFEGRFPSHITVEVVLKPPSSLGNSVLYGSLHQLNYI